MKNDFLTIDKYFEHQAIAHPQKKAVISKDEQISFSELNKKANQFARLLRNSGANRNDNIVIVMSRSINYIMTILGILKIGAVFIPLNINDPQSRIKKIVEDCNANAIILDSNRYDFLHNYITFDNINLELFNSENLTDMFSSHDVACILYTSGSTGRPKGVKLDHKGFANNLFFSQKEFKMTENDTVLNKAMNNFDASVWEILTMCIIGTTLCLCENGQESNVDYLTKLIETQNITVCFFVSSMLNMFLSYIEHKNYKKKVTSLRLIFGGGEILSLTILDKFYRLLGKNASTKLYNWYGPTEATVYCTYFDCSNKFTNTSIPIGNPIENVNVYILDENGQKCKEGESGEIFISGCGVGSEYVNNEKLTATRFLPDPFHVGYRMYKTGDLGKRVFGQLEFHGRIDNQVKIRGNRMELEEVENAILNYSNISQAIVVNTQNASNDILVAFYISDEVINSNELKRHLSDTLPEYMIPQKYEKVTTFPYNANGKIDRKKVMRSIINRQDIVPDEILNPNKVLGIIQKVLNVEPGKVVNTDIALFDLGVDSLSFIHIIIELEQEFGFEFDTDMLLMENFPKISSFIDYIEKTTIRF